MSDQTTKILIVDDDQITRSLVAAKLKTASIEVIEAEDGLEAWNIIKAGGIRLALVDVHMPNMNGLALVQCVRSHPATRHMPIVMVTSRDDHQTLQRALEAGATSYLTKPINWSLFAPHIEHLLRLGAEAEAASDRNQQLEQAVAAGAAILDSFQAWLREWPRKNMAVARSESATDLLTNALSMQRRQMLRVAKWAGVAAQCMQQKPTRFSLSDVFRRPDGDAVAAGAAYALSKAVRQCVLIGSKPAMEVLAVTARDIAQQGAEASVIPVDLVVGPQAATLTLLLPPMAHEHGTPTRPIDPATPGVAPANVDELESALEIISHVAALHGGHADLARADDGATELTINLPLDVVQLRAFPEVAEIADAASA